MTFIYSGLCVSENKTKDKNANTTLQSNYNTGEIPKQFHIAYKRWAEGNINFNPSVFDRNHGTSFLSSVLYIYVYI